MSLTILLGGLLTVFSLSAVAQVAQEEFALVNPTSKAKLWAAVFYPADANGNKRYPAVVFIPGGLGFGSGMARTPQPQALARAGFVVGYFDPDGRGRSEGKEHFNGKVHQDGLHAFLKHIADLPQVRKDNIGVLSSSLGLALAAGALGRYPDDPPVKYFIDNEGPSDRFYITKNDDPRFLRIFNGHTTKDADWWAEREAVRSIGAVRCAYLRVQHERDHVHGENKQHAIDVINAATHTRFGGKGKSPWTRVNGPENSPNTVYTRDNPPKWLPDQVGPRRADDTLRWIQEMAGVQEEDRPSRITHYQAPLTFFAVHCEPQAASPVMWDALARFVAMADRYGAKLTLMFNPQWAQFVCGDEARFARLKTWQKAGHEIAVHYHNVVHGGWNGYTNRKDDRYTQDARYRGTVPEMMKLLQKLAAPDTMLTVCMGPDARWDSLSEVEIDEPDYPDGITYDVDGMNVGLTRLMKTKFKGRDLFHLKHHFFAPGHRAEHLEKIKEEFRSAKSGDVLGVVTHEADFARSPEFIERWFQFCQENKTSIRTVREIIKSYPRDKVVEVKYVRQGKGPAPRGAPRQGGIFAKVRKFQELLKAKKNERLDTSAAEELDRQSREAAHGGRPQEAERLLDRAIELLERLVAFGQNNPPAFDVQAQPNRNQPGPWDNDVLVYRVAPDGRVAQLATFERAGVPTVARFGDGRLIAAHQHFPADNNSDFDKVAVRFSSDEGRTWTGPQVIRLAGLPEGMRFPFDPTLVPLPDGRVRLYFTSLKGRRFEEDRPAIYSAVSSNGVDYTFESGVRFGVEGRPVIDCAVALHQGVFHLYSPDNGTGGPPGRVGDRPREGVGYHATSRDGLNFTRADDVQIEGRSSWLGNAQSDGKVITFFGTGGPDIWTASSGDGQKWRLGDPLPREVRGADPGAVKLRDGGWLVVATGPPRAGTPGARQRLGEHQ
jgi:hypothetical protein